MMTTIKTVSKGNVEELAVYSIGTEKALVCYYMQQFKNNYNTWDYPETLPIIKPYKTGGGHYMTIEGKTYISI